MEEGNKKEKDEKSKKKIKESIIKHSPISMRETTHPSGIDSSEREEKLWSLDVYIHEVIHFIYKSTNPMLSNDCCVGFRLWDFPLMYIQKPEGPYTNADTLETRMFKESFSASTFYKSQVRDQESYSSHNMLFRTGKSIVFSMKRDELGIYVQTLPLYVFLFILTATKMDGVDHKLGWKPVLIGSVHIPLHELKVFEEVDTPKGQQIPQRKTISGTFSMKNDRGYDVAVIDMDVRLRQLSPQPGYAFNDCMTNDITKTFSLQRPLTPGGPNSKAMDLTLKLQTGAVTRNPLLTVSDKVLQSTNNLITSKGNIHYGLDKGVTGELGTLSSLVHHYKQNQQQTKIMKGQIEAQIAAMTAQLSHISSQLKEKTKVKKSKKSDKVLYTESIKRPSSTTAVRPQSTSSVSSKRHKSPSISHRKVSQTKEETLRRVTHSTTKQRPSSACSKVTSQKLTKPSATIQQKRPSSKLKSPSLKNYEDAQRRIEEELAQRVINNLQQQYSTMKDDERQGTTLSGVIPQLADTFKLLNNQNETLADESQNDATNEYITIPCELYKTIKDNNDRYNNLQKSYQLIMDEFMDNPSKLFSSMTKIDTRGMSLREKELWKNQNKLITLLKENYDAIKQEKDLQALKAPKQPTKATLQVEEVEESLTSSTTTSARSERNVTKENSVGSEQRISSRQTSMESLMLSKSSPRSVLLEPVKQKEPIKASPSNQHQENNVSLSNVHESDDYETSSKFNITNEEENTELKLPKVTSSASFETSTLDTHENQENNNLKEVPNSISVNDNAASIAITNSSFEDFDEDFETSQTMDSSSKATFIPPPTSSQSDTLRSDHDFAVVQVQNNERRPANTSVQEEEFEDFEENEFEHAVQNQVVEEEDDEDVTYEEQQEGHQEPSDENEVVHSIDYSGIEERAEEEDRI
nr:unnamed protein product [Naegleria fowleri]